MKKIKDGTREFEIVDRIPDGYKIWDIPPIKDSEKYIPLCKLIGETRYVDTSTLKAIKIEDERERNILRDSWVDCCDIDKIKKYIKRYSKSKNKWTLSEVECLKEVLPIIEKLKE